MHHEKKIKFSINPEHVNRHPPSHDKYFAEGFIPIEDTISELANFIEEEGWAFSYHFKNNYRNKANFIATDICCVDVDGGLTLSEALKDDFVLKYCSLIYTTARHTHEHHRFRLVFILPRTITKIQDIESITKSLARRFGGDQQVTDAAHMFYGSKKCHYIQIFENYISEEMLIELIENGKTVPSNESYDHNINTSNRSNYTLNPETIVTTKNNQNINLKDIDSKISIHCPFHADKNPSAFASLNKDGKVYVHCKTCAMTWWMKTDVIQHDYKFYEFEETVDNIVKNASSKLHQIDSPLSEIFDSGVIQPKNIHIVNEQYLTLTTIEDGITFIKSHKGTGKTTYLTDTVKKIIYPFSTLESYEESTDGEFELPFVSSQTVLLLGHRQALIQDMCNKLGLNCYLDDNSLKSGELKERKKRYGVCLDSLAKVREHEYQIIIIDEVEQVLNHFLSETIGEKRIQLFHLFISLLQKAKKIVALDADLGIVSFITLTSLLYPNFNLNSNKSNIKNNSSIDVNIYINKYHPVDKFINVYASKDHLIQVVLQSIVDGKRIYITSNSKLFINNLYEVIIKFLNDLTLDKSILKITSDNSKDKISQFFIQNIKLEILKYDIVMSSPSLGTGIDITFDNEAQEIDCVFGFFENQINSHFEIDQQIARVRNPKEVCVWLSPSTHCFETDFEIVVHDLLYDALIDVSEYGIFEFYKHTSFNIDPFYIMAAMIVSYQRASKNNLKYNFINYKIKYGWEVNRVKIDENLASQGRDIYREGKILGEKKYLDNIMASQVMNQLEYIKFKDKYENNISVNEFERISLIKTNLELFYGELVSEQLIQLDDRKKFRSAIIIYSEFIILCNLYKNNSNNLETHSKIHGKLFKNSKISAELMYKLLSFTPLLNQHELNLSLEFSLNELDLFVSEALKYKNEIFTQFDITLRTDLSNNPTKFLSSLLGKMGLKLVLTKAKQINKKKINYYKIDMDSYNLVDRIFTKRQSQNGSGWDYLNLAHNFEYTKEELDYIELKLS